jgi:hypothetical protein
LPLQATKHCAIRVAKFFPLNFDWPHPR